MADDVIGSEDAVAEQARMFDTPGTPWYAVSKGTLDDIKRIWPTTPCCRPHHKDASMETPCPVCGCTADVFARGPVGENVLHLAVLFHTPESVKMAKYLIDAGFDTPVTWVAPDRSELKAAGTKAGHADAAVRVLRGSLPEGGIDALGVTQAPSHA